MDSGRKRFVPLSSPLLSSSVFLCLRLALWAIFSRGVNFPAGFIIKSAAVGNKLPRSYEHMQTWLDHIPPVCQGSVVSLGRGIEVWKWIYFFLYSLSLSPYFKEGLATGEGGFVNPLNWDHESIIKTPNSFRVVAALPSSWIWYTDVLVVDCFSAVTKATTS